MQVVRDGSLATFVPELARVFLVGPVDDELRSSLMARGCDVRDFDPGAPSGAYDVAIVVGFPSQSTAPAILFRELASGLATDGRLIVDASRLGSEAARAAVGDVSDDEARLYGRRSVIALLEEAGLEVLPAVPEEHVLEAVPKPVVTVAEPIERTARPFAVETTTPDERARLAYAEREVTELRAFFRVIHDNQRRLQEEIARARAALGDRDIEIAKLQAEILRSLVPAPEDEDRDRTIARRDAELREVKGRVADLEARIVRLREALVELRDGSNQASTE